MEGAVSRRLKIVVYALLIAQIICFVGLLISYAIKAQAIELPSSLLSPHTDIPPEPGFVPGKMWMGRWHAHGRSPCWKPIFIYSVGDKWQWDEQRCPPA